MFKKSKAIKVEEVVVEEFVNNSNITIHADRWDDTVNTNVSKALPSLDDQLVASPENPLVYQAGF